MPGTVSDNEPFDPRTERSRISQLRQLEPCIQKGVLYGISRIVVTAQRPARGDDCHALELANQRGE